MTDKPVASETVPNGMVTVTVTKLGADKIATGNAGPGYELNEYYGNKAKITMPIETAVYFEDLGWVVVD